MHAQNGSMLLRVCGACLHEVSSLRREVHEALDRLNVGAQTGAETPPPPPLQVVKDLDPETRKREALLSSCTVSDKTLRELLVSACENGELTVSLSVLAERAQGVEDSCGTSGQELAEEVLAEFTRGGLRVWVLRDGSAKTDRESVETAIQQEIAFLQETGTEHPCIIVSPRFRRPTGAFVEVLVQRCREERLLPPLDLLLEALIGFISEPESEAVFVEEADLLLAIDEALVSGPRRLRSTLELTPTGRIVIAQAANANQQADTPSKEESQRIPLPLYCQEEEADVQRNALETSSGDAVQLTRMVEQLQPHLAILRAVCCDARPSESRFGACFVPRAHDSFSTGVLVGILGVLRTQGCAAALGLPEVLIREADGGALLWALEREISGPPKPPVTLVKSEVSQVVTTQLPSETPAEPVARVEESVGPASDSQEPQAAAVSEASPRPAWPASPAVRSAGQVALPREVEQEPEGTTNYEPTETCSLDGTPFQNEQQDLKSDAQVMFVQCFKEDLVEQRHLLMSQINNLFKMRNGGNSLQYKAAGYDKLHDFLLEIPGLAAHGSGNKMEIKIVDLPRFEAFCEEITEGREVPSFEKPQPIPESFQWRVIEVFRRAGSREIPAKSFRDLWNCCFPAEKLYCKDLGYRDVKGLLANVSLIEKVGSKQNTRYVLKSDVDISDSAERGMVPAETVIDSGGQPFKVSMPSAVSTSAVPSQGMLEAGCRLPRGMQPVRAPTPLGPSNVGGNAALSLGQVGPTQLTPQLLPPQDSGGSSPAWGQPQSTGLPYSWTPATVPNRRLRPPAPARLGVGSDAGLSPGGSICMDQQGSILGSPTNAMAGEVPVGPGSPTAFGFNNGEVVRTPTGGFGFGNEMVQSGPGGFGFGNGEDLFAARQRQRSLRQLSPQQVLPQQEVQQYNQLHMPQGGLQGMNTSYDLVPRMAGQPSPSTLSDLQGLSSGCAGSNMPRTPLRRSTPTNPASSDLQELLRNSDPISRTVGLGSFSTDGGMDADVDQASFSSSRDGATSQSTQASKGGPQETPAAEAAFLGQNFSDPITSNIRQPLNAHSRVVGGTPPGLAPRAVGHEPCQVPARSSKERRVEIQAPLSVLAEDSPHTQAASDDSPPVGSTGPPPGLGDSSAGSPTVPDTLPESSETAEEPSSDSIVPLTAAEHRKQRRQAKKNVSKQAGYFVSSPGAISTEDRDASKCQGKFDMSTLYQAQLRTDRRGMIVDFSNGRVLLSNALCDSLFETMCPLPQRDVADLIHEDDRLNFSACVMYLSIGKFAVMEPQFMRLLTAKGEQRAMLAGEQLVGSWWWLDISLPDEVAASSSASPPSVSAGTGGSGGTHTPSMAVAAATAALGSGMGSGAGSIGGLTDPASVALRNTGNTDDMSTVPSEHFWL